MEGRRKPSGRSARGRKPGAGPPPIYEWDRRIGESPEAYEAFLLYRDMRPADRSLRALAERYRQSGVKGTALKRRFEKWSAEGSWTFRVDAWDAQLQRITDDLIRERLTRQVERHMALGDGSLVVVTNLLQKTVDEALAGKISITNPLAVLDAVDKVIAIQAKVAAEAVLRVEKAGATAPYAGARDALLRKLAEMHEARVAVEHAATVTAPQPDAATAQGT